MNKMMMAVAGLAMAVVLTGCGGSPKGVAEDFVKAVIQKDGDKAIACAYVPENTPKAFIKVFKEEVEKLGKGEKINDDKLDAEAVGELISVPAENSGYKILNGKKFTGETATVGVQFVKGKDKKSYGMIIHLAKVDGSWKVIVHKPYEDYEGEETKLKVNEGFDTGDDK